MGKNPQRVCGICGEEKTTGWTSHKQRKHNGEAIELVEGQWPIEPQHTDWFERLSKEMRRQYASSKPVPTANLDDSKSQQEQNSQQEQKEGVLSNMNSLSWVGDAGFVAPQSYMQMELQKLKQENELLRASLSDSTRSQSAYSKFTDGSLGSVASAEGLALRRWQKMEVDALNKKIGEQKEKLKRTRDKYEAQLKEQKEKIENKDSEVVELKVQLGEIRATLKERDKQLGEWKVLADGLIINNASFDEFKQKMKNLSVITSAAPSLQPSPAQSEYNHSDHEIEDQTTSAQELFGLANLGLTCYIGAALQCIQAISVKLEGKLVVDRSLTWESLKLFYKANLRFQHIFAHNDSSEALLQLLDKCLSGQLMQIQIKQERRTQCKKCKAITGTFDKQLLLPLPCSHSDFQNCLENYLMKESLVGSNQFECTKCKSKVDADTWLELQQTNDILLIQLNRFVSDGITTQKRNELINMPLKFVLNNQQYQLFVFVVHLSQSANKGHYVAYANQNGTWSQYNDDDVASSVDIDIVKDKGYYYCYHRIIKDYATHVEQLAQQNVVEKECAYCHTVIVGPATYHVPSTGEVNIAGAMVDHLKQCQILVQYNERANTALQKTMKKYPMPDFPSQDIRTFFFKTSKALTLCHQQVCSDMNLVKKASKKRGTKIL